MGLQACFTRYPWCLCLWDSSDTKSHYYSQDWPQQTMFTVVRNNIKWEPLVDLKGTDATTAHQIGPYKTALKKKESRFQDF